MRKQTEKLNVDTPPKQPCFKTSLLFSNKTPFLLESIQWRKVRQEEAAAFSTKWVQNSPHHVVAGHLHHAAPHGLWGVRCLGNGGWHRLLRVTIPGGVRELWGCGSEG